MQEYAIHMYISTEICTQTETHTHTHIGSIVHNHDTESLLNLLADSGEDSVVYVFHLHLGCVTTPTHLNLLLVNPAPLSRATFSQVSTSIAPFVRSALMQSLNSDLVRMPKIL